MVPKSLSLWMKCFLKDGTHAKARVPSSKIARHKVHSLRFSCVILDVTARKHSRKKDHLHPFTSRKLKFCSRSYYESPERIFFQVAKPECTGNHGGARHKGGHPKHQSFKIAAIYKLWFLVALALFKGVLSSGGFSVHTQPFLLGLFSALEGTKSVGVQV